MTAPGPADPSPGSAASPAPAAPVPAGSQVNPPVAPPAAVPSPQQPAPQVAAPQQPAPQAAAPQPAPPQPVAPQPAPQQQPVPQPQAAPQQPAPQQAPAQLPAAQQPAALPAGPAPAALPVPAAPAGAPVLAAQAQAPAVATAAPAKAAPPAKATPPAKAKKAKTSSGGGGGYLVAVFALLVAVIAGGVAAYSLKIAMEIRDDTAAAPIAEPTVTTDESAGSEPAPTPSETSTPTATLPAGPQFAPELVRVELRVPNPSGCTAGYVDVDTGNVGVENGHEFYLSRCQNPTTLQVRIDRTSGRSTSGADPSPEECASLVAGTPTAELVVAAEPGLTFCLLTNRAQAIAANLPQRLAIVEVLAVGTAEVRLALSTYRIEE